MNTNKMFEKCYSFKIETICKLMLVQCIGYIKQTKIFKMIRYIVSIYVILTIFCKRMKL